MVKRKKKQNNQVKLPPPLPQPRTNEIQVTTNTAYDLAKLHNDAPDVTYETIMDTTNPAYGLTLSASAGLSVDTNISYGIVKDIRTTATNGAQQQDETPPATNPTVENTRDSEVVYCPCVTHPTYKEEVYDHND